MDNFSEILTKLMSDPAVQNAVSKAASEAQPQESTPEAPPDFDMGAVINTISALTEGGGEASSSRTDLLKALKPFVNSRRSVQIDRMLSMLNTAAAARSAMKALGGKKLF